jgi:hypothetical protein
MVRFVVDCPALNCRREPWFAVERGREIDATPCILVALPGGVGERGVALGRGEFIATLVDGRVIVRVALPKNRRGSAPFKACSSLPTRRASIPPSRTSSERPLTSDRLLLDLVDRPPPLPPGP